MKEAALATLNLLTVIIMTSAFANKKALVLGGSSGIGLAACIQLFKEGANVVACGRTPEKLKRAEDALSKAAVEGSGSFSTQQLDVLDEKALRAFFVQHAGFDYLVCTATGGSRAIGPFMDMDMEGFQGSFRKLWGYANAVRHGAGQMTKDGNSAIVLVSGSPARKCKPGYIALSCVGGAVENLVRALAVELAPIRVNGVSPGFIDTPMFDGKGAGKAEFFAKATANYPVPRAGTSDEVSQGILFALQNKFCTGTIIDVDGGSVVPS